MKNAAAILLLSVFLFNVAGYRLFFFYADRQADASFTTMVDQGGYNSTSLLTVSLPLHMPYIGEQGFERAEGQITVNGQIFKYVSRAVRNDSLILRCLPAASKTAIAEARARFGTPLCDNPTPGKKGPETARKFVPDNDYDLFGLRPVMTGSSTDASLSFVFFAESILSTPSRALLRPPAAPLYS